MEITNARHKRVAYRLLVTYSIVPDTVKHTKKRGIVDDFIVKLIKNRTRLCPNSQIAQKEFVETYNVSFKESNQAHVNRAKDDEAPAARMTRSKTLWKLSTAFRYNGHSA